MGGLDWHEAKLDGLAGLFRSENAAGFCTWQAISIFELHQKAADVAQCNAV